MTIRITVRHLPAASSPESLIQLLEQNGINTKQEHVKVHRIFVGKAATKTKSEVPSTAFLEIPNDAIGLKICKALETKDSPIRVELAFTQKVPTRITSAGAKLPGMESINIIPGSWKEDPEYLRYEQSLKPKPKPIAVTSEETSQADSSASGETKKSDVAPLVAHMLKELQAKRNKSAKAEGRKRKAKAEATAASKDESAKTGAASQKQATGATASKRGGGSRSKKKQAATNTGENKAGTSKKKPAKADKVPPATATGNE